MSGFPYFLIIHSWIRWVVLLFLAASLYRNYQGWLKNKTWTIWDQWLSAGLLICLYLQIGIGLILYTHSPIVSYFLKKHKRIYAGYPIAFFWHGAYNRHDIECTSYQLGLF